MCRLRLWLLCLAGLTCVADGRSESPFDRGIDLYRRAAYDSVLILTATALAVESVPVEQARLLTLEGYVHRRRGDYDSAIVRGEQALDLLHATNADSDRAWTQNLLGLVAYDESRFDDAIRFFNAVREVGGRGNNEDDVEHLTRAAINLGLVYQDLGDFARARQSYLEGVTLARQIKSRRLEGIALNSIGLGLVRSGLAHLAIPYFRDARTAYREIGDPSLETNTLGQLGLALIDLGDFEGATSVLDSAVLLAREYGLKQEEASNLSAKAEAQLRAGDGRSALATLAVSESLNVAMDLPYERAMDLRSRAVVYRELNELELASATIARSSALHDSIGTAWDAFADQLFAVGLAADRGDLDLATNLLNSLRAKRDKFGTRAATVEFGLIAARVALERGEPDETLRILGALDGEVGLDQPNWRIRWATMRAGGWTAQQAWDSAIVAAEEAVAVVERLVNDISQGMLRSYAMNLRLDPFLLLTNARLARGDTIQALFVADRARGQHIRQHRARTAAADPTREDRLAVTARMVLVEDEIRRLGCPAGGEWTGADVSWCAALDSSATRLRRLSSEAWLDPEDEVQAIPTAKDAFQALRSVLRSGETLVQYLVAEDSTIVFRVSPSGVRAHTIPFGMEAVHRRVRLARNTVDLPSADSTIQRQVLSSVYRDLLRTALDDATVETLIVVPHASLSYLPFGALVTERDRYLIEEVNLLLIPSISTLTVQRSAAPRNDVDLGGAAFAPLEGVLPATRVEVGAMERVLDDVDVFRGRRSTKARLIDALESKATVHLATHGELRIRNPMASHLALAGRDDESKYLAVHEIVDLNVNSRLVFLSGCETALSASPSSRYFTGEDYATLAQAFLQAGAGNVVATLWRVDDRAAADFAAQFYESYAGDRDPLRALAQAQRSMISHSQYGSPYYWAGYQVAGRGE